MITSTNLSMLRNLEHFQVMSNVLAYLKAEKPEELKLMQGFPADYIIDRDASGKRYPICEQTAKIGNSVSPVMAKMLVEANCPYLREGERMPNMSIEADQTGQLRFA